MHAKITLCTRMLVAAMVSPIVATACGAQDVQVRRTVLPPLENFSQLREKYGTTHTNVCDLPDIVIVSTWGSLPIAEGRLPLRLPPGWRLEAAPDTSYSGDLEWVLRGPHSMAVRLSHITNGAVGRSFMARNQRGEPAEGIECHVERGTAGALWTLYAPGAVLTIPDSTGHITPRYSGLGDLISPGGERFKARIGALSAAQRDTLAKLVTDAVLTLSAPQKQAAPN